MRNFGNNFSVRNGCNYVAASATQTVIYTLMFCGGLCSRREEETTLYTLMFCGGLCSRKEEETTLYTLMFCGGLCSREERETTVLVTQSFAVSFFFFVTQSSKSEPGSTIKSIAVGLPLLICVLTISSNSSLKASDRLCAYS
jgi:hypothetical protein